MRADRVTILQQAVSNFVVISDAHEIKAQFVLLATGIVDKSPAIAGTSGSYFGRLNPVLPGL
jgi:thioredoxin reductase